MENKGLCSDCDAIEFSLTSDEFQVLRIYLTRCLYNKGKPAAEPEIFAFSNMLQDINCKLVELKRG